MIDLTLDLKVILAALAIVTAISIAIYSQWWRNRKKLSYEIITKTSLLTASEEIKKELQIIYKGEPVTNVNLLVVRVVNDGFQPIKKEDFEKELSFVFSEGTKFLTYEVVKVNPDNLQIRPSLVDNSITFEKVLLNSKDSFDVKILSSSDDISFKPDGRIVGVNKITNKRGFNFQWTLFRLLFGITLLLSIWAYALFEQSKGNRPLTNSETGFFLFVGCFAVVFSLSGLIELIFNLIKTIREESNKNS